MTVVYAKTHSNCGGFFTKAYAFALEWNGVPTDCSMSNWYVPGTIDPS